MNPAYDVFISYRREGGAAEARLIQAALKNRKIRAFLDVTDLGRGYFDEALLRHIERTPNFLVILSQRCLDRCANEEDWLRKEIAHAITTRRNIVPVMMPGFQFPLNLPPDIRNLPRHQGLDYSHLYFEAMMQRIQSDLDLSERPAADPTDESATEERLQEEQQQRLSEQREQQEKARLLAERQEQLRRQVEREEEIARQQENERLERERQERLRLEQERKDQLEREQLARQQKERERQELEQKERERQQRLQTETSFGRSLLLGDFKTPLRARQALIAASWLALVSALAMYTGGTGGSDAAIGLALGTALLLLALGMRFAWKVTSRVGTLLFLVSTGLMAMVSLHEPPDGGRFSFAFLAAASLIAFWRAYQATRQVPSASGAFGSVPSLSGSAPHWERFREVIGAGPVNLFRSVAYIVGFVLAGVVVNIVARLFGRGPDYPLRALVASTGFVFIAVVVFRLVRWPAAAILLNAVAATVLSLIVWGYPPTLIKIEILASIFLANLVSVASLVWALSEIDSTWLGLWSGAAAGSLSGLAIRTLLLSHGSTSTDQALGGMFHSVLWATAFAAIFAIGLKLTGLNSKSAGTV